MLVAGSVGRETMRIIADVALINKCELLAVMPTELLAEHDPVVVWTGDSPVLQLTLDCPGDSGKWRRNASWTSSSRRPV